MNQAQEQARREGRDPYKLCIHCGGTRLARHKEGWFLYTGIAPHGNGCNMCLGTGIDGTHPPLPASQSITRDKPQWRK